MAIRPELQPTAARLLELNGTRVLVPIIRGQEAAPLLSLGLAIASHASTQGVLLGLVEIPASDAGLQMAVAKRSRELLSWIAAADQRCGSVTRGQLALQTRFVASVARGIREAALETLSDTVVLEWPSRKSPRRHILEAVLRSFDIRPPANLVMVRPDPAEKGPLAPRSVLAPVRGGPNARLALAVAAALAAQAEARLTVMHVYDSNRHRLRERREAAVFHDLIQGVSWLSPVVREVIAPEPAALLLRVGGEYDAVVMGAHVDPDRTGVLVGPGMKSVVHGMPKTLILTRSTGSETVSA